MIDREDVNVDSLLFNYHNIYHVLIDLCIILGNRVNLGLYGLLLGFLCIRSCEVRALIDMGEISW
jgi:hypothetical protein